MYLPHTPMYLPMALVLARAMRCCCAIIAYRRHFAPAGLLQFFLFLLVLPNPLTVGSSLDLNLRRPVQLRQRHGSATNVLTIRCSSFSALSGPLRRWLIMIAEMILQSHIFHQLLWLLSPLGGSWRLGPPSCQIVRPSLGPPNRPSDLPG